MTISSSLNAAVMGLGTNAMRLGTISDNIANSATNGYKRSFTEFSSMVLDQRQTAFSAGGVRADAFKDIAATGSLISTGNSTDLAIAGRGMLPVTNSAGIGALAGERDLMLLPTGSFTPDQNGHLRTQSGLFLLGWPADETGQIANPSRTSGASLEPVNIATFQFAAEPTTAIQLGINLPADATRSGAPANTYDLPVEYFDDLGRANVLNFAFSPVVPTTGSSNQWQVEIFDSAGDPALSIGTLDLTFAETGAGAGRLSAANATNGATYDPATGLVTINLANGPVTVAIGAPGQPSGLSQLAAPFSPTAVSKDGAPISDLQAVEIDEQGTLHAIYDTGFRRALYQIPVGDTPNINALEALDNQAYAVSAASGDLFLWDAGTGPVGAMSGYSLMASTTDIASELTDLIETQRAYSSNAKIVQTVDEMLQETTNLKR